MKSAYILSEPGPISVQKWIKILLASDDLSSDTSSSDSMFPKHTPFVEVSDDGKTEIMKAEMTMINPQVLIGDVNRTRASIQSDLHRKNMTQLLSLYCLKASMRKYIQGMNELLAPIYFLEQEVAVTQQRVPNLSEVFNCFSLMISKLLPTTFQDDEFISLQCFFAVLEILLKYHEPGIALHLTRNSLGCELYAMGWIMTYFANKVELSLTYRLWTRIFQENDKLFILFLSVALVSQYRQKIFECDPSVLPQVVTSFTLHSEKEVDDLITRAVDLREETPHSFCLFVESTGIFNPNNSKHSYKHILTMLENSPCIPIFPEQLLHYSYPEGIECPNPKCYRSFKRKIKYQEEIMQQQEQREEQNSPLLSARLSKNPFLRKSSPGYKNSSLRGLLRKANSGEFDSFEIKSRSQRHNLQNTSPFLLCTQRGGDVQDVEDQDASPTLKINESLRKPVVFKTEEERFAICEKCRDKQALIKVKFVLLDCRAKRYQKEASLPNCVMLNIDDSYEHIQEMLEGSKGIHHLCIIGLSQQQFEKEDWNDIIESITSSRNAELSQSNESRSSSRSAELSLLHGYNHRDDSMSEEEFHDKIQTHLICDLLSKNFPYVSYVSGGFQHCHDLVKQYNLELNDHKDRKNCFHCGFHDRRGERLFQKSKSARGDLFHSLKSTFSSAKSKLAQFMNKNIGKLGNSQTADTSKNQSEASCSSEESTNSIISKTTESSPFKKRQEIKSTKDIDLNQISIASPEDRKTQRRLTQPGFKKLLGDHELPKTARNQIYGLNSGRTDYPKMFGPRKQITTSMMKPQLKTFEPTRASSCKTSQLQLSCRITENVSPEDLCQMPRLSQGKLDDSPHFADLLDEGDALSEPKIESKYLSKELVLKICDSESARVFDCSKVILQKNKAGNSEIIKSFEVFLILRKSKTVVIIGSLLVLKPVKGSKEDERSFTFGAPRPKSRISFEVQNKLYLNELERITARAKTVGIISLYFLVSRRSLCESGINGLPPASVALLDDSIGDKHNRYLQISSKNRVSTGLSFEFKKMSDANDFTQSIRQYYKRVKPF